MGKPLLSRELAKGSDPGAALPHCAYIVDSISGQVILLDIQWH